MKLIALSAALVLGSGAAFAQTAPTPQPSAAEGDMTPVGGLQPATPPMASPPPPGAKIIFQPAPPPNVAFPPPAPLAEYPLCKKGQYDKCRQRGG